MVQSNLIGTDRTGIPSPTGIPGNLVGVTVTGSSNTIGGANIIGGNKLDGIDITGSGATGNVVLGNFIGTNASGANLGNVSDGSVHQRVPPNNTIGGANTIGFNSYAGIDIFGSVPTGNVVLGNFIGTNAMPAVPTWAMGSVC